jgi:hypothetical protein
MYRSKTSSLTIVIHFLLLTLCFALIRGFHENRIMDLDILSLMIVVSVFLVRIFVRVFFQKESIRSEIIATFVEKKGHNKTESILLCLYLAIIVYSLPFFLDMSYDQELINNNTIYDLTSFLSVLGIFYWSLRSIKDNSRFVGIVSIFSFLPLMFLVNALLFSFQLGSVEKVFLFASLGCLCAYLTYSLFRFFIKKN